MTDHSLGQPACLLLEDGSLHRGESFGAAVSTWGEVVFNTSMTGYQEVLTDPSYAGQLVTLTYPLVGNYGINCEDIESRRIQVSGLVVREHCDLPSHGDSRMTLHEYLLSQDIPGISGVDTRAITRRLRTRGVMTGLITTEPLERARERLAEAPRYDDLDLVKTVTTGQRYSWEDSPAEGSSAGEPHRYRILVTDSGLKYNILRLLRQRGCEVIAVPAATTAGEMLALNPSGILMSPGPGDPQLLDYVTDNVKQLVGRVPMMGICLGHQLIARAMGASTYKLKFGHRGANHPVKDLSTGKVYITAQNHGYAVDADSLPPGLEVSLLNLNDNTVEGLAHRSHPLFSIQYHSEASPGPRDNEYIFDQFLDMVADFHGA